MKIFKTILLVLLFFFFASWFYKIISLMLLIFVWRKEIFEQEYKNLLVSLQVY